MEPGGAKSVICHGVRQGKRIILPAMNLDLPPLIPDHRPALAQAIAAMPASRLLEPRA